MRPLTVGDPVIIGPYLLLGRLGAGGMGVVYLAEHPGGGLVALKTPHPVHLADATLRARFAEEMEFSRRLVPFQTAAVIEDGVDREHPFLVTEYIPGPALSQVVAARGPLTPDLAYGVALGAAAALVAVHEAGLVHRDLKPGNVLLSPAGPYVIDFGIALDVDTAAAHTQAGQIMGSPGWVAPERLMGGRALPASDVFSWGCLVAFAATGCHPFGSGDTDVLTRRILVEEPRIAAVPTLLRASVAAALSKEPAERPGARELLGALLAAGGVGAPDDLREAVAAVLEEIWQPVPHPAGGAPAPPSHILGNIPVDSSFSDSRNGQGRTGGRPSRRPVPRRDGHISHAGFAALATVSIAAVTVVAAGAGRVNLDGTGQLPEQVPYVVPGGTGPLDSGTVLDTGPPGIGGTPGGSPAVGVAGAPRTPAVTATALRPPGALGGAPGNPWSSIVPSPGASKVTVKPTGRPPGEGDPGRCDGKRGRSRSCPSDTSTAFPSPTGSVTRIPDWGDGESPTPSATATPAPAPSPSA